MKQLWISLLTIANILTFLGILYFFLPGFPHWLLAGGATSWQPNQGFLCVALFLFLLITAVQVSEPALEGQIGTCWACRQRGQNLIWWHPERPGNQQSNKRVSYLIHPGCSWMAEKRQVTTGGLQR